MESKKLNQRLSLTKPSQPVLPMVIIRKVIRMCIELQDRLYEKLFLENRSMWLAYGGKLVLEDITSYERYGAYRCSIVTCRRLKLWHNTYAGDNKAEFNMDGFEATHGNSVQQDFLRRDWVARFNYIEDQTKRLLDQWVDKVIHGHD
jgi:hypothetical protein